jgi:hypothetical protein
VRTGEPRSVSDLPSASNPSSSHSGRV